MDSSSTSAVVTPVSFWNRMSVKFITPIIFGISRLPLPVLHRISDVIYFWVYHVFGYRVKVVRENLANSFPEKSLGELRAIERKFYRNFGDLLIETLKMFTISKEQFLERCQFESPEVMEQLRDEKIGVTAITSHVGNWEWMGVTATQYFHQPVCTIYKPLKNPYFDKMVRKSRERFGVRLVPIKELRSLFTGNDSQPIVVALLADQAPHDYSKAIKLKFLNQDTHVVIGPALITLQNNYTPIWGWNERIGRSRFRWKIEILETSDVVLSDSETDEAKRIAQVHGLSESMAIHAVQITKKFCARLEQQIKMAPQDWLWSHRRWKKRD